MVLRLVGTLNACGLVVFAAMVGKFLPLILRYETFFYFIGLLSLPRTFLSTSVLVGLLT